MTKYSFTCTCPRCNAEARAGPALMELQASIHAQCESDLGPALERAIGRGDEGAVMEAAGRLRELRGQYEAAVKAAKANAKTRRWMQASVFSMYDLMSLAADELSTGGGGGGGAGRRGQQEDQVGWGGRCGWRG